MARQPTTLVWLRDELRVHDNALLAAAAKDAAALPVFCLDPRVFDAAARSDSGGSQKTGARRAKFVLESLADLRTSLEALGSGLVVRRGSPEDVLAELATGCGDARVVCSDAACPEEQRDEAAVASKLPLSKVWEGTLYHRDDLTVPFKDQFTAWRTSLEKVDTPVRADCFAAPSVPAPPGAAAAWLAEPLPTLADLGYDAATAEVDARGDFFAPVGGETAALARLKRYVWDEDRLKDYFETRNGMIGQGYSTKFAPWLARGCLSPRTIARECEKYERTRVKNKSTYWVKFELTWRDYFVFFARKYGGKLFRAYGAKDIRERKWKVDASKLEAWKAGKTGVPLVDANMRELAATGFMSNRGRQNVASYLVLDLGLDWRLGAEHFEELLVDYTPESNHGNWHAAAGLSGGRLNRFNTLKQSKDYDPDGAYVKLWLPELAGVPAPDCFQPHKTGREVAYPKPLQTLPYGGGGGKGPYGGGGGKGKAKPRDAERATIQRKRKQKNRLQGSYMG